jgi:chemosensory pili system protein ChpC
MNAVVETVRSLWVPLEGLKLLVPNVAIAEVINYQPVDEMRDGPDWLLGVLRWREQELPVVSMERLLGLDVPPALTGARISVFNSVKAESPLSFYAALTTGIPSLFSADADELGSSLRGERDLPRTVADCIRIGEVEALIPDLEVVQGMVDEAWTITVRDRVV